VDEPIKFFVGLDVHKDSMSIAACEAGREPARFVGTVGPDMHAGKNPHLDYQQKALGQPARLERGSFHDGSMHGGSQPTDISLIHRRSSRLASHHRMPPPNRCQEQSVAVDESDHISPVAV
jgi:hypothetical protein